MLYVFEFEVQEWEGRMWIWKLSSQPSNFILSMEALHFEPSQVRPKAGVKRVAMSMSLALERERERERDNLGNISYHHQRIGSSDLEIALYLFSPQDFCFAG